MKAHVSQRADELEEPQRREIHIPLATIVKVLATLLALWTIYELGTVIALVLVAAVLAISLEPVVVWFERHGVVRWVGSTLTVFAIVGCLIVFFGICGSSLASEGHQVTGRLGSVQQDLAERIPPPFDQIVRNGKTPTPDGSTIAGYAARLGSVLSSVVLGATVAFILTIYLLIDGRRTWAWLVAYVPRHNRARVQETANAACHAVLHYVIGNVLTSVFAGVTVLVALTILRVPAALLLALTVSTSTAIAVALVYVGYHMAENYFIGPKVYGGQLRLSNLAVLLAFAVGAELFGIIGALLALPVAAMYPCVEDVWLREYLALDAVETHRRIERQPPK